MDRALSHPEKREPIQQKNHHQLCLPALKLRNLKIPNPFSVLALWVSKSLIRLCHGGEVSNGSCLRRLRFEGMMVNNSAYCASPCSVGAKMEAPVEKTEGLEEREDGIFINGGNVKGFVNVVEVGWRESSSSSDFLVLEETLNEEHSHSTSDDSSSPPSMGWPVHKSDVRHCANTDISEGVDIPHFDNRKLEKQGSSLSEIEMMKERFSKLLLGEDMSGCGNGVCTALAISNAVTNLCATIFGQIWRLEPVPPEKKSMWRREMEWLLCVSDHIVELIPSWQTFPDGSKLEVMTSRPRSDLHINLPALRKLDNMLLEILDSFIDTDFWYVDQGILDPDADGSASFRRPLAHQEEKWWLPVPRVPPGGLGENSRKRLQNKRDCTNQILKAAMAINSITLADMEVPESYFDSLPKNGRASLGDLIHRYITSEQFSPECLLDCLDLSSEHQALEIANRVEASIYIWRRRINSKPINSANRSNSRSSWEMVKELVIDLDKRELLLADRAESVFLCLKQRFPGLPQTTLDMTKIQYNKDVGKSILESYSRVLESLAFNVVARIDDLVYVDDLTKHSDQLMMSISKEVKGVGIPYMVPISSTPYKTAFTTPSFSPTRLSTPSPAKGEQYSTLFDSSKIPFRGVGVKKVLTDYLNKRGRNCSSEVERSDSSSQTGGESFECSKKAISLSIQDSLLSEE